MYTVDFECTGNLRKTLSSNENGGPASLNLKE